MGVIVDHRISPAPYTAKRPASKPFMVRNTRFCPNLTVKDRILNLRSPSASGTSFINAITIPNTPKNKLDSPHFQSFNRQFSTPADEIAEAPLPNADERAWL
eukprot:CAMPEP_0196235752 /NCGR_PEP_ID=MMETSP0913-20130531/5395_1 /TAXON_ID=49265 /ORGANISM="Thalassiosira rotula, Strain GSO102" /LENGTH=101 /DNA_ID=CAMNT_0041517055 /DNA_START=295 /DNA_END=600 /DNA_ORIENTATION=-